jgi:uncharacterized membrane protein YgdD (TMEM256/DUF423 family)
MTRIARTFLLLGVLGALLGVLFGAFGAHALRSSLSPDALALWKTAVEYQMYHSLGLLALGLLALYLHASRLLAWSGWLMAAGIVLFCGSLYALALGAPRGFGIVTPFGGTAFLAAWALAAATVFRARGL